jgi:hypothetical protein
VPSRTKIAFLVVTGISVVLFVFLYSRPPTRAMVEYAHGVDLPLSARNFQQRRDGLLRRHFTASLFEMDKSDLNLFTNQLVIETRRLPKRSGPANPLAQFSDTWPTNSTFVGIPTAGFRRTWHGEATPLEASTCKASKGYWLHIEIWSVEDHTLIRLDTEFN